MADGPIAVDVPEDGYDPLLHITADELRRAGIPVDASIPDCAWIPRADLEWSFAAKPATPEDQRRRNVSIQGTIVFRGSFRWTTITGRFVE